MTSLGQDTHLPLGAERAMWPRFAGGIRQRPCGPRYRL